MASHIFRLTTLELFALRGAAQCLTSRIKCGDPEYAPQCLRASLRFRTLVVWQARYNVDHYIVKLEEHEIAELKVAGLVIADFFGKIPQPLWGEWKHALELILAEIDAIQRGETIMVPAARERTEFERMIAAE